MKPKDKQDESLDTLEDPGSLVVESEQSSSVNTEASPESPVAPPTPPLPKHRWRGLNMHSLTSRFNVYFFGFLAVLGIAVALIILGIRINNRGGGASNIPGESLSAEELSRLQGNDASVGDPKQTLTIESNTVINGKVLLRDNLDVAGTIKVGGTLSLPGITVAGSSNFDQIEASRLSITGDTTIQGQLSVQRNLTVSGSASFGGAVSASQLNVQTLSLSGDLQINRHIDSGGATPSKADGGSLGGGGTSSVSGSDTAGTVTINTGSGPGAGCYITVTFAQKFSATPHIVITPVGSGAAGLNYYISRSSTNFSICSTNAPASSASFSFDYIALD